MAQGPPNGSGSLLSRLGTIIQENEKDNKSGKSSRSKRSSRDRPPVEAKRKDRQADDDSPQVRGPSHSG